MDREILNLHIKNAIEQLGLLFPDVDLAYIRDIVIKFSKEKFFVTKSFYKILDECNKHLTNNIRRIQDVQPVENDFFDCSKEVSESYRSYAYKRLLFEFPNLKPNIIMKVLKNFHFHLLPSWKSLFDSYSIYEKEEFMKKYDISEDTDNGFYLSSSTSYSPISSSSSSSSSSASSSSSSKKSISSYDTSDYLLSSEEIKNNLRLEISKENELFLEYNSELEEETTELLLMKKKRMEQRKKLFLSLKQKLASKESNKEIFIICPICTLSYVPEETISCERGHRVCNSCVIDYMKNDIQNISKTTCLVDSNCNAHYKEHDLEEIMGESDLYNKYLRGIENIMLKETNSSYLQCSHCGFTLCFPERFPETSPDRLINDPEEVLERAAFLPPIFHCLNYKCGRSFCTLCMNLAHSEGEICPIKEKLIKYWDENEGSLKKFVTERMSESLLHYCPRCKTPILKLDKCNHMTCVCGCDWCYCCGVELPKRDPYVHFHMGPKSCPLDVGTSQERIREIEKKKAFEEGKKADKEWREKHPNFKGKEIDIQKLLDQL